MSQNPNTGRDDLERGAIESGDPGADPYATAPDPDREGPGKIIGDVLRSGIEGAGETIDPRGGPEDGSDDSVTETGDAPSDPGTASPGRWGVPDLDNRSD